MRSRVGTSAVNRRKFIEKIDTTAAPAATTSVTPTPKSTPVLTKKPSPIVAVTPVAETGVVVGGSVAETGVVVVPASTVIDAQGIVIEGTEITNNGNVPVSTNFVGQKIITDDQGRMDLSEIEKMNPLQAGAIGTTVPTDQMLSIAKDVAYGVDSKNQASMESGLDLLLNPLIKPFVDPRLEQAGVITDKWYWPDELRFNWNVLPEFMQTRQSSLATEYRPPETRSLLDGLGANFGNIGAIIQSPLAHEIAADELAVSEERFNRSSGTQAYYIGSALGEIPYFLIGAGQIKKVATVAVKATAGIVRGTVKGPSGVRLIATTYAAETAAAKLEKAAIASAKAASAGKDVKLITKPVSNAVKILKGGYDVFVKKNKKAIDDGEITGPLVKTANETITEATNKANALKALEKEMNVIDKMKDNALTTDGLSKQDLILEFNKKVTDDLLPETKRFKNQYLADALDISSNSWVEKLARTIQGSPVDAAKTIDNFFNRVARTVGDNVGMLHVPVAHAEEVGGITKAAIKETPDTSIDIPKLYQRTLDSPGDVPPTGVIGGILDKYKIIEGKRKAGEYEGGMGMIKLNKDLYGNVVTSALGIDRATLKLKGTANLISSTFPTVHVINAATRKQSISMIDENIELIKDESKKLKWTMDQNMEKIDPKNPKKDTIEELKKLSEEDNLKELRKDNLLDEGQTPKERIAINDEKIAFLESEKTTSFAPYDFKFGDPKAPNFKKEAAGYMDEGFDPDRIQTTQYRFSFAGIGEKFPVLQANLDKMVVSFPVKPSVSVRKTMGVTHGTIGVGTEHSMDFWLHKIPRKEAINAWDEKYISNSRLIDKIGLKKLNTPIGTYRTLMPWKAQEMEDVVTFYQARDQLKVTGIKSGTESDRMSVMPIIMGSGTLTSQEKKLLQLAGFLEDYDVLSSTRTLLGASPDDNRWLMRYRSIGAEDTSNMVARMFESDDWSAISQRGWDSSTITSGKGMTKDQISKWVKAENIKVGKKIEQIKAENKQFIAEENLQFKTDKNYGGSGKTKKQQETYLKDRINAIKKKEIEQISNYKNKHSKNFNKEWESYQNTMNELKTKKPHPGLMEQTAVDAKYKGDKNMSGALRETADNTVKSDSDIKDMMGKQINIAPGKPGDIFGAEPKHQFVENIEIARALMENDPTRVEALINTKLKWFDTAKSQIDEKRGIAIKKMESDYTPMETITQNKIISKEFVFDELPTVEVPKTNPKIKDGIFRDRLSSDDKISYDIRVKNLDEMTSDLKNKIEGDIVQFRKYENITKLEEDNKKIRFGQFGTPKGTLFTLSKEKLKQMNVEYDYLYKSGIMQKNTKTGKSYFNAANDDVYEIVQKEDALGRKETVYFNPELITDAPVTQQTRTFYPRSGSTGYQNVEGSTTPTHLFQYDIVADPITGFDKKVKFRWSPQGEEIWAKDDFMFGTPEQLEKQVMSADPNDLPKGVSGSIWGGTGDIKTLDMIADERSINLSQPGTYEGILIKLSEKDARELKMGKVLTKATEALEGSQKYIDPKKSDLKNQVKTTVAENLMNRFNVKIGSWEDTRNKIKTGFIGEEWKYLDTNIGRMQPDKLSGGQAGHDIISHIGRGDVKYSIGGDAYPMFALTNADPSKGIMPGKIPGGVTVETVYEQLNTLHTRQEFGMDNQNWKQHRPTGSTQKTNYQILEEAVRQEDSSSVITKKGAPVELTYDMLEFKKAMINLVHKRINKGTGTLKKSDLEEIARDPNKYKTNVENVLNKNNKKIRLPTKKDRLTRNKSYINPLELGPILSDSLARDGLLKRIRQNFGDQMVKVVSDDVAIQSGSSLRDRRFTFMPTSMNKLLGITFDLIDNRKKIDNRKIISSEAANPFFVDTYYNVLKTLKRGEVTKKMRPAWDRAQAYGGNPAELSQQRSAIFMDEAVADIKKRNEVIRIKQDRVIAYRDWQLNDPAIKAEIRKGTYTEDYFKKNAEKRIAKLEESIIPEDRPLRTIDDAVENLEIEPVTGEKNYPDINKDWEGGLSGLHPVIDPETGKTIMVDPGTWDIGLYRSPTLPKMKEIRGLPSRKSVGDGTKGEFSGTPGYNQADTQLLVEALISKETGIQFGGSPNARNILGDMLAEENITITKVANSSTDEVAKLMEDPKVKKIIESKSAIAAMKEHSQTVLKQSVPQKTSKQTDNVVDFFSKDAITFKDGSWSFKEAPKQKLDFIKPDVKQSDKLDSTDILNRFIAKQKAEEVIGFKQQGVMASPFTANVATRPQLQPSESEYQIPNLSSLMSQPQPKNIIDQTIGDLQSTMKGIGVGLEGVSDGKSGIGVKSFTLPSDMQSTIGVGATKSDLSQKTFVDQIVTEGYNYIQSSKGRSAQGTAQESGIDLVSLSAQLPKLMSKLRTNLGSKQMLATQTATSAKLIPKQIHSLRIDPLKTGKLVPQRIVPLAPFFPPENIHGPSRRRRYFKPSNPQKKTWWQTPENWWQPYYWGGKDQTGAGYVTFKGKEPGKVKKYEKKHFGIGVGDEPFGIKGDWF